MLLSIDTRLSMHLIWSQLKRKARVVLGRPQPSQAIAKHPFDALYGVDTSGLLDQRQLRTGHVNDAFTTAYFGVPPSRFTAALQRWEVTPETSTKETYRFIDVGCGKGRAVLLASSMSFRDVVGVELHPKLAMTARVNLTRWQQQGHSVTKASIVCGDGPLILPDLLSGPVLVYLYNPFQVPVLRALLAAILDRYDDLSGTVDVLYLYPEYKKVFDEFPQFKQLWHEEIHLSIEDANDGLSASLDPCSLYRLHPQDGLGKPEADQS